MTAGTRVRMTAAFKAAHSHKQEFAGCHEQVEEFGDCVGVVIGPVDWPDGTYGPELDVRWEPSGLKYAYKPQDLEKAP